MANNIKEDDYLTQIKKWFKRNLTWVYFTIAIVFILFPNTNYSPFTDSWNNLIEKIGFIGLTSGVFASVLKSIQFTGLFKEELTKIISGTEFLNNRKDLPELWKKISKSIYDQKFPEISDLLEDRILTTYFPMNNNHYNEDFIVSIVIHDISDDFIINYTQTVEYNEEKKRKDWGLTTMKPGRKEEYVTYMKNQIKELIENYDSEIIWFDADWTHWWTEEDGNDLYQYIRTLKPNVIINNRVSKRDKFKKDFGTPEQFHPDSTLKHYWEACYTMNDSWGFKIKDTAWKSPEVVYEKLKDINGKGGNFLLNIGPDGDGNVPKESAKILKQVGKMLAKEEK